MAFNSGAGTTVTSTHKSRTTLLCQRKRFLAQVASFASSFHKVWMKGSERAVSWCSFTEISQLQVPCLSPRRERTWHGSETKKMGSSSVAIMAQLDRTATRDGPDTGRDDFSPKDSFAA